MSNTRKVLWALAGFYVVGLVALMIIFGITTHKNNEFQPQNEFKLTNWVHLGVFSINRAVLYLFIAAVLTVVTMVWIARRMHTRPNRVQTAVEVLYSLMRDNITRGNMDDTMAARWFPFIGALFLFIWYSNLIGYLPLPTNSQETFNIFGAKIPSFALYASTANVSVPLVLAIVTFVAFNWEGVRVHGPIGYFKSLIPVRRPWTDPALDRSARGHLDVHAADLAHRPTVREHPRGPHDHPVHGRRSGGHHRRELAWLVHPPRRNRPVSV